MTDDPQTQDQAAPGDSDQPKTKKPFIIPFHAVLKVFSPIRVVKGGVELQLGDLPLPVPVTEQQRLKLQERPPEADLPYFVTLWFRTPEGYVQDLEFSGFSTLKGEEITSSEFKKPEFQVGARLKAVNREEGFLVMQVEPNPGGLLQEAFDVQIWAALDLLAKLSKVGRTLVISGEYRPFSGRLVATGFKWVKIGQPLTRGTGQKGSTHTSSEASPSPQETSS